MTSMRAIPRSGLWHPHCPISPRGSSPTGQGKTKIELPYQLRTMNRVVKLPDIIQVRDGTDRGVRLFSRIQGTDGI